MTSVRKAASSSARCRGELGVDPPAQHHQEGAHDSGDEEFEPGRGDRPPGLELIPDDRGQHQLALGHDHTAALASEQRLDQRALLGDVFEHGQAERQQRPVAPGRRVLTSANT
ncbi:hypothetical protein Acor_56180 [Acrocarpospora corrugata]|uniref:Uncharacterized protein n=1 Tax=Acrocarpospora corrugata TaxID=35763 RepID=A0A5M3W6C5_9ACTN|nr:hypothetical protein [Acrocarpospora corrugata]GES03552.1 hypothetical protein Acor_56180 [Acrocarpospora corrugata]